MGFQVSNGYLSVILVLVGQCIITSEAIKCYKCIFAPYVYFHNNSFLCKDFDYSEKFITDCPYSTFCMKKNLNTVLDGVSINGTERACAYQKHDTQRLQNGKWTQEIRVEEPYSEECKQENNNQYSRPFVEHCYCRGELCNSGNTVFGQSGGYNYYRMLIVSVLSVLMTIKAVHVICL